MKTAAFALILAALPIFCQPRPNTTRPNAPSPEARLRAALFAKTGTVTLPTGVIEISREIALPGDAHDLKIHAPDTTIKASAAFRGRALLILPAGKNITISGLTLDGNRAAFPQPVAPAPSSAMLSRVIANNGILAEGVTGLELDALKAKEIAGFPVLISGGRNIRIQDAVITDSGSLDLNSHNNGTGGVVLEEGVTDFDIIHAVIGHIRGNGVWIRSVDNATATRGRIADSEFTILARAAIAIDHATGITIENNTGHMIGFPGDEAITTAAILPAAIASSGSVDHTIIRDNSFDEIAGRCFALEGFSNGEISGNSCLQGLFNGFLIRGANNRITGNHLSGLNQSRRDSPESLRAGIYLAGGSSGNTIDGNDISGFGMAKFCIGGPGAANNKILRNACSDGPSVAWLLPATPR